MNPETFDMLFTTDRLQRMKLVLPLFPSSQRAFFAMYIKLEEFLYILHLARSDSPVFEDSSITAPAPDLFLKSLLPFCSGDQEAQIRNSIRLFEQLDEMKDMMEMAVVLQEAFPEGMGGGAFDPGQMSQLFEMFSGSPPEG